MNLPDRLRALHELTPPATSLLVEAADELSRLDTLIDDLNDEIATLHERIGGR